MAFQKRSIFSKTRIDTDASSRHSEDLFASREVTTEISTKVNTDIHVFSSERIEINKSQTVSGHRQETIAYLKIGLPHDSSLKRKRPRLIFSEISFHRSVIRI